MKIILRVVGPLFVAVGLFWFAQGTGLLTWPHNAAMVDYGAGIVAVGFGLVWFGWQYVVALASLHAGRPMVCDTRQPHEQEIRWR